MTTKTKVSVPLRGKGALQCLTCPVNVTYTKVSVPLRGKGALQSHRPSFEAGSNGVFQSPCGVKERCNIDSTDTDGWVTASFSPLAG